MGIKEHFFLRAYSVTEKAAVCILASLFVFTAHSWAADLGMSSVDEQIVMMEVPSEKVTRLQVTLLIPSGSGKFPVAVLNHGKNAGNAHAQGRWMPPYAMRYFLSRGYAVAIPMLRGFAGSDGDFDEGNCNAEADVLQNARDIKSVIQQLSRDARLNSKQIVVVGQSYGGFNTLAVGSLGVPGVRALVNFAGIRHQPACYDSQMNQLTALTHFAKSTKVRSLWFYGTNDQTIPEYFARVMFGAYQAAGGQAEMISYGKFSEDAHAFLNSPQALQIWSPILDEFLALQGLPTSITRMDLLPRKYPKITNFANIDDVDAVPYLSESGRKDYKEFLRKPLPKAAVISREGSTFYSYGGYDPLSRALNRCLQLHSKCDPYAVDNEVVWTP